MTEFAKLTEEMTALMTEFLDDAAKSVTKERGTRGVRLKLRKITSKIKLMGVDYRAASVQMDK